MELGNFLFKKSLRSCSDEQLYFSRLGSKNFIINFLIAQKYFSGNYENFCEQFN